MTDIEAAPIAIDAATLESVVVDGNLANLNSAQRLAYYQAVCESVGLNPLTKPFDYIILSGRLTLYARKDATDQLRRLHHVSLRIVDREWNEPAGLYLVVAQATTADGRSDESVGAVSVTRLTGDSLANAIMKAETKAKRRVTLAICGLGMLDETEIETVREAEIVAAAPNPARLSRAEIEQMRQEAIHRGAKRARMSGSGSPAAAAAPAGGPDPGTPDEVRDDQPEAYESEPGSERYDPDDNERPF
jgi:hypothetical protein